MREMGGYLPLELRDTGEYFRGIPDEWIGRYDCGRTALYAAIQALKEYWAEGEEAKWARHTRVFNAIHKGLDELGFRDVIKREWQAGLVVSAIYPDDPNWDFSRVHDYCYERGFTIYPGKISTTNTFRLCALGAIDEKDITDFFAVFREALESVGVQIPVIYKDEKK